jgi:hypothetical protein
MFMSDLRPTAFNPHFSTACCCSTKTGENCWLKFSLFFLNCMHQKVLMFQQCANPVFLAPERSVVGAGWMGVEKLKLVFSWG